jgi:hypothetical protein
VRARCSGWILSLIIIASGRRAPGQSGEQLDDER